ncbi:MAG: alpha/beta hydrolase [Pseudomonadota bacterium]
MAGHLTFELVSQADGTKLAGRSWLPPEPPRAIVQISHGLAEHCLRYDRFAASLLAAGIGAYAHDHRGHGHSLLGEGDYGNAGPEGWPALTRDLVQVTDHIRAEHSETPLFVFGHSMGSFAAQKALLDRSDVLAGVILSGSTDIPTVLELVAATGEAPSFEAYNAAFEPARTAFDWLSRDEAEVDAYVNDAACGWDAPDDFLGSMMMHAGEGTAPESLAKVRADLPLLFLAGDADPLNGELSLLHILMDRYRQAGLSDIDSQFYKHGRHEMLNEINRDEVTAALLAWISQRL